jgi:HlyD family secretion protein
VLNNATTSEHPELKPVQVRIGINDGINTEIVDGLKEGDLVVTGVLSSDLDSSASRPVNPFGGGGFPRR